MRNKWKRIAFLCVSTAATMMLVMVACSSPNSVGPGAEPMTFNSNNYAITVPQVTGLICTNVQVDPTNKKVASDCYCLSTCGGIKPVRTTAKCNAKQWDYKNRTVMYSCSCDFRCGFPKGWNPPEPKPEPMTDMMADGGMMDGGMMDMMHESKPEPTPEPMPEPKPDKPMCPQGYIMTMAGMCVPDVVTHNGAWHWRWYDHTDGYTYIYFWGIDTGCGGYKPSFFTHFWLSCLPNNMGCVSDWSTNVQPVTSYMKGGQVIYVLKKPMGYQLGHPFNKVEYDKNGAWPVCWQSHQRTNVGQCKERSGNMWQCPSAMAAP